MTGRGLDYLFLHLTQEHISLVVEVDREDERGCFFINCPLLWSSTCCCLSLALPGLPLCLARAQVCPLTWAQEQVLLQALFWKGCIGRGEDDVKTPFCTVACSAVCLTFPTPSVSALLLLTSPHPVVCSHLSAFCLQFRCPCSHMCMGKLRDQLLKLKILKIPLGNKIQFSQFLGHSHCL